NPFPPHRWGGLFSSLSTRRWHPPQRALHLPAVKPALRANDSLQTNQQVRAQTVIELTLRPPLIEGGRGNTANFTANLNSRRPK
ncbi:MAG: hypothetical protein AB8B37_09750, partial [Prochlorococcus sp.]